MTSHPAPRAGTLSAAQKQMVEIARAIKSDVKVLALDEPTSSLSERDSSQLFDIVNQFRSAGVAIIYVSHRLPEILQLADRIAILRDGKLVAVRKAADTTESDLVSLMVGRDLVRRFDHQSYALAEVVLKVEGLTTERVRDISFEVHRGEIVGFAGLVGAGRTELAKALFGEDWIARGQDLRPRQGSAHQEPAPGDPRRDRLHPRRPQARSAGDGPQRAREYHAGDPALDQPPALWSTAARNARR